MFMIFLKSPWIEFSCILNDYRLNENNCGGQEKCFVLCSLSNKEQIKQNCNRWLRKKA